jgi:hypothetical protein
LKTIDYGVETPAAEGATASKIILKNHGSLQMPVEVLVKFRDGTSERHYIPLDLQYGTKRFPEGSIVITHPPWNFSVDTYEIRLEKPATSIQSVSIDPDEWTADTNRSNNRRDF